MIKFFVLFAIFLPNTVLASANSELIDAVMLSKSEPKSREKIEKLLDGGASANAIDEHGKPVLHWAIIEKDPATTEMLLRHGADVELREKDQNWTPLMQAAYDAVFDPISDKQLSLLVKHGAKVDAQSKGGTALMYVVSNSEGHPNATKVAKYLLDHKADPNFEVLIVPNRPGITLLMAAAKEGATEIARLLLKHGANPRVKGAEGKTAADIASESKHETLAEELRPKK